MAKSVVSSIDLDSVLLAILTSAMHFAATPAGTLAHPGREARDFQLQCSQGFSADFAKDAAMGCHAGRT